MLTLADINALDQPQFVEALGGLFEGPPWIVTAAWHRRPFASTQAFYDVLCAIIFAAPLEQQVALLQAHPDLAGKAAQTGTLGAASTSEQQAAGLNRLSPEELATFTRLNMAYQTKFGFPFVICARQSTKAEILAAFSPRLEHTPAEEVQIGLGEVCKIGELRLHDLMGILRNNRND